MSDNAVTLAGNLTADPELRFTSHGVQVAGFRLAVTPRIWLDGGWKDGKTSYFRVRAWRDVAANVAESLGKGDRVLVVGRLRTRSWEAADGDRRSVVEVEADEVGVSLRWAIARPQRAREQVAAS